MKRNKDVMTAILLSSIGLIIIIAPIMSIREKSGMMNKE
jgi:hypothetical protein